MVDSSSRIFFEHKLEERVGGVLSSMEGRSGYHQSNGEKNMINIFCLELSKLIAISFKYVLLRICQYSKAKLNASIELTLMSVVLPLLYQVHHVEKLALYHWLKWLKE